MAHAVLGLGSNLGARRALLRCALHLLAGQPGLSVVARSPLYETPPLGPPQPDYLNAAIRVAWCGSIEGLFRVTQQVELLLGRERRVRWGARTLDIDLLHWSEGAVHTPWLDVPHPELCSRSFALAPMLAVMPELEPTHGDFLRALGGAPPEANPGWLDFTEDEGGGIRVELSGQLPDDEIACLAVSAVGACARKPPFFARAPEGALRPARASLFFSSPQAPMENDASGLLARVETLRSQGFRVRDAAITEHGASGTRGFLIGEHSGAREIGNSPRVIVEPASGLARTLRAFPPGDP